VNLQNLVLDSTPSLLALGPLGARPHLAVPQLLPMVAPPVSADTLRRLPLLCQLDPAQALWLTRRVSVRRVARQARVVEQGGSETGLYYLLKGHAQAVRQNTEGRSLVIDQLRPGDHFGELSLLDEQPQTATVRCTVNSELLVVSRADFMRCLDESPALLQALLQTLVHQARRKNRHIALLALNDVRGCVVQQLIDQSELRAGQRVVTGRISRQAIADMIGASRAMVSRVMMVLTRSGAIELLPDGATVIHCQPPDRPARRRRGTSAPA
jgi:CRP-like cAMP-binding protein